MRLGSVRKIKRNASRFGTKAEYTQVSYFNFETGTHVSWRKRRYRESLPKQKRLNEKRSRRYFEALVEANFKSLKDLHITLTFAPENYPESKEAALKEVKKWISRLNYRRKKQGKENCKYIIVFEVSKTGRYHFHILMDGAMERDVVEEQWKLGFCNADRLRKDARIGFTQIANYLCKGCQSGDDDPEDKHRKRWIPSHGLIKPWISVTKVPRISNKRFNLLQQIPVDSEIFIQTIEKDNPGYWVQSVEREYNQETGAWHIFARMRLKLGGEDADDNAMG